MKNTLTLFIIFLTLFLAGSQAQVPNGGFEKWTQHLLFEQPAGYNTSALQTFFAGLAPNVTKVPGFKGQAARLETIKTGESIIPGMLFLGTIGSAGFGGGYPYAGKPDSFAFQTRYKLLPGDTATVLFLFLKSGSFPSFAGTYIAGTQNNYTRLSFPIKLTETPDTILFLIVSGNPEGPATHGSWIEIDEMEMVNATVQLPNASLDNWIGSSSNEPDNWLSSNFFNLLLGTAPKVTRSTDSKEGNYAVRIETFLADFGDEDSQVSGFILLNGVLGDGGPTGGIPYPFSSRSLSVSGKYKYSPIGKDSAIVFVNFSRYNPATLQSDSIAEMYFRLPAAANYTSFSFPVSLPSLPDTVLLAFASSNITADSTFKGLGSVLLLDAVALTSLTSVSGKEQFISLDVFPNPARHQLNVNSGQAQITGIEIIDMSGRTVFSGGKSEKSGALRNVDISSLNSGYYVIRILTNKGAYAKKFTVMN